MPKVHLKAAVPIGALKSRSANGALKSRSANGALVSRSSAKGALANEPAQSPQQLQSDNESDAEEAPPSTMIDKRTAKRIAAAELHELDGDDHVHARRSIRQRTPARQTGLNLDDFGHVAFAAAMDSTPPAPAAIRQSEVDIPSTRRMAMRSKHWAQWEEAMHAELTSIREHDTFVTVTKPHANVNIVSCKWVFAVKAKDGVVLRFKARLVARGFSQQYGVDYEETYSPVLKYKTLRILLSIVCIRNLTLELMDVQTAYLNAPLKETVYMAHTRRIRARRWKRRMAAEEGSLWSQAVGQGMACSHQRVRTDAGLHPPGQRHMRVREAQPQSQHHDPELIRRRHPVRVRRGGPHRVGGDEERVLPQILHQVSRRGGLAAQHAHHARPEESTAVAGPASVRGQHAGGTKHE